MSTRRIKFHIILLMAFVCFCQCEDLSAQVTDTVYADSVLVEPSEDQFEETEDDELVPDSAFVRYVPDSIPDVLKKKKEFEYANDPEYWMKKPPSSTGRGFAGFLEWLFSSPAVRLIFYIVIGAVLVFAVYRIIVNNSLFYRSSKTLTALDDTDREEIEDEDLESKLQQAIAAKDFRKATRYLYFNTLRKLDNRGWIRYHSQATNQDYLAQASQFSIAGDFRFLTQVYEYVWYGGFELNEMQFNTVNNRYQQMIKVIRG